MFSDEDFIMISSLQHFLFCPRQCGIIHVDVFWRENELTVSGKLLHARVDTPGTRHRADCKVEYSVPLRSLRLGLSGMADIVEFHKNSRHSFDPVPVEYKHGKPKEDHSDEVQLCAQALCLEEMMHCSIPSGILFYGKENHRHDIPFSPELRSLTELTIQSVHRLVQSGKTPPPLYRPHVCESCSVFDYCRPKDNLSIENYLDSIQ